MIDDIPQVAEPLTLSQVALFKRGSQTTLLLTHLKVYTCVMLGLGCFRVIEEMKKARALLRSFNAVYPYIAHDIMLSSWW